MMSLPFDLDIRSSSSPFITNSFMHLSSPSNPLINMAMLIPSAFSTRPMIEKDSGALMGNNFNSAMPMGDRISFLK